MDEAFINSARTTLLDHLEDDGFGVAELSRELGLSKSQVLRKIKRSTGKTVSEFIKEVRLKEAVSMLQDGNFTVSEIAYRVGFGSPSYFNKCFHDYYGVTPGEFKLQEKNDEIIPESVRPDSKIIYGKTALIISIIFIFFTALFLHFNFFKSKDKASVKKEYAIAILPFLNLAENDDSDYLSDGITEAITLEISRNKTIRVISRGSAMAYKNTGKSYAEIAKNLGVNLLLEGSVFIVNDSLSVVAQLIEPFPKEKHLWAGNYNMRFENVLSLVNGISAEISRQINLAVRPREQKAENYPVDPVAYDLYLRGRHLYNLQTPKSVQSAIDYLNSSIEIDSNFAPAYAILSENYILLNKFIQNEDEKSRNVKLGRLAIERALEKGPYLAEAYITKGNILGKFDWDWEGMRRMTEKGLELDPNNAYGHTQMSKYFLYKNNISRSIDEALIAEKLDPLNPRAGRIVAEQYFYDRQFEKSLEQFEKVLELHPEDSFTYNGLGLLQWVLGEKEASRLAFLKFQQLMNNHSMAEQFESSSFDQAIEFWLERAKKKEPLYCSNPSQIAMVSAFMGQEEEALLYLEAAYTRHDDDLPGMLLHPMFETLYHEPRFLDVAARTGVNIPIAVKP